MSQPLIRSKIKDALLTYGWPELAPLVLKAQKEAPINYNPEASPTTNWKEFFERIEKACFDYQRTNDYKQLVFTFSRLCEEYQVALTNAHEDLRLISFLGKEPKRFFTKDLQPDTDSSPPKDARSKQEFEQQFSQLFYQSEAADQAGQPAEALNLVRALRNFAYEHRAQLTTRQASAIGNAAVTAEGQRDYELADDLYQLALELNANSAVIMQNFVDFVVKAQWSQRYEQAMGCITHLKKDHSGHRPENTLLLEAQLNRLTGKESPLDPSAIEQMIGKFRHNPKDQRQFSSLALVLQQVGDFEHLRELSKLFFRSVISDHERYVAVRGFADVLAASPEQRNEFEAMEIYRFLSERNWDITPQQRAGMLHNYATLLYKHDYDYEAGVYWYDSYNMRPNDDSVQRLYADYLLRERRPDLALLVSQGSPLEEKVVRPRTKELPTPLLNDIDRWWEQTDSA